MRTTTITLASLVLTVLVAGCLESGEDIKTPPVNDDVGSSIYTDAEGETIMGGDELIWSSISVTQPDPNSTTGAMYDVNDMWGLEGLLTGEYQIFALLHGGIVKIIDQDGVIETVEPTNPDEKIVLNAIWAKSEHSIIVAGAGGVIRRYTCIGSSCFWQNLDIPILGGGGTYRDLWGLDDEDVYVVGLQGAIHHYNGTTWIAVTDEDGVALTDKDLEAVWGFKDGQVFVVGDGVVLHKEQSGEWSVKEVDYDLRNVHGLNPTDMYAVGAQGTVVNYNGNSKNNWTDVDLNAAQSFNAIYILDQEHIYIGGWNASIFFGDGASFEYMSAKTEFQKEHWLPSTLQVYEIWGVSTEDLYLLGNDNLVYHYSAP